MVGRDCPGLSTQPGPRFRLTARWTAMKMRENSTSSTESNSDLEQLDLVGDNRARILKHVDLDTIEAVARLSAPALFERIQHDPVVDDPYMSMEEARAIVWSARELTDDLEGASLDEPAQERTSTQARLGYGGRPGSRGDAR